MRIYKGYIIFDRSIQGYYSSLTKMGLLKADTLEGLKKLIRKGEKIKCKQ